MIDQTRLQIHQKSVFLGLNLKRFLDRTFFYRLVICASEITRKMAKYTHGQRLEILRVCLSLSKESLPLSVVESKIRAISSVYPLNTIPRETSRLKKYLSGQSTYGYGYAATWAKALLEVTNNDINVVAALKAQQKAYLEKDGKVNQKLEALLDEI